MPRADSLTFIQYTALKWSEVLLLHQVALIQRYRAVLVKCWVYLVFPCENRQRVPCCWMDGLMGGIVMVTQIHKACFFIVFVKSVSGELHVYDAVLKNPASSTTFSIYTTAGDVCSSSYLECNWWFLPSLQV